MAAVPWPPRGPDLLLSPPRLAHAFDFEGFKTEWSSSLQGSFQAAGIFVSLAMALGGGLAVGEWEWLGQGGGASDALWSGAQELVPEVSREPAGPFDPALVAIGLARLSPLRGRKWVLTACDL